MAGGPRLLSVPPQGLALSQHATRVGVTLPLPPRSRCGDRGAERFWKVLEASAVGASAQELREGCWNGLVETAGA